MYAREEQRGVGGVGDGGVVETPLDRRGGRAEDAEAEGDIGTNDDGAAGGLAGEGGRNEHGECGVGAVGVAGDVADEDRVGAFTGGLGVGDGVGGGGRAGDVRVVELPLVIHRRGADGGDREGGVAAGDHGAVGGLDGDDGRPVQGQHGDRAGDHAGGVGDDDAVVAEVGDREGINREARVGLVGQRAEVPPLIGQRRGAGGGDGEGHGRARIGGLVGGLHGDARRHKHGDLRDEAGGGADEVAGDERVVAGLRGLGVVENQVGRRRARQVGAEALPLVTDHRRAVGEGAQRERGTGDHGLRLRVSEEDGLDRDEREAVRGSGGEGGGGQRGGWHVVLAFAIAAPGDGGAVGFQREAVGVAGGDGEDVGEFGRHGGLAFGVQAPAHDGAVAAHGEVVVIAGGDGDDVGESGGHAGLIEAIVAPRRDGAVGAQRKAVVIAACNGDGVGERGRHRGLAEAVVAPAGDAAIGAQREAVAEAGGDGDDVAQAGGHGALALEVAAPRDDRAVRQRGEAVIPTGGEIDRIGHGHGDRGLVVAVETPCQHGAVAAQRERVFTTAGDVDGIARGGDGGRLGGLAVAVIAPGRDAPERAHFQPRRGADDPAGGVGDGDGVTPGGARLDFVQLEGGAGFARQRHAVETPLIIKRRRARGVGEERHRAAAGHRLARGLAGDDRGTEDGERRGEARVGAGDVGDRDGVGAGVGGLDVGEVEGRVGFAGQRDVVPIPLIGQRRGAGGIDRERGGRAENRVLAERAGADGGRYIYRQHGGGAEVGAGGVAHADTVAAGVGGLGVGAGVGGARRAGEVGVFKLPLERERGRAGDADKESGVAVGHDRAAGGREEKGWRDEHGERGGGAVRGAGGVADDDAVIAGVGGLAVGEGEGRVGFAREIDGAELPLE